jgi:hypothetical protein
VPHIATVAAVAVQPAKLLERLRVETQLIEHVMPRTVKHARRWVAEASHGLGGYLSTARQLSTLGVDLNQPASLFQVTSGGPVVVSFGLRDRRVFDAHLKQVDRAQRRIVDLDGEKAIVIFADSDLPVACLVRASRAQCQLGLTKQKNPLSLLTASTVRRPRSVVHRKGMQSLLRKLPAEGLAHVVFEPQALSKRSTAFLTERTRRAGRLDTPKYQRARREDSRVLAAQIKRTMSHVELAAATLLSAGDTLSAELHITVDGQGARHLQGWLDAPRRSPRLEQWARTPALARFVYRGNPQLITRALTAGGMTLAPSAFGGTVAILALGINTETPVAKTATSLSPVSLLHVVPTAIAVNLAAPPTAKSSDAPRRGPAVGDLPVIRRRIEGGEIEIRARDEVVLLGVGPGSGAAAERRWRRARSRAEDRSEAPFVELGVDFAAVSAAFKATVMSQETRRELVLLNRLQYKLTPLLHRYRTIDVRAWAQDRHRRLKVRLDVRGGSD